MDIKLDRLMLIYINNANAVQELSSINTLRKRGGTDL